MRKNILILAADTDDQPEGKRTGDLFDQALVEIVHALDVPARIASVLIPWSADLSPLIAAAIVDTAPSFDPEGERAAETTLSGLVPYLPPGAKWSDQGASFFRSSHLALERESPLAFADAIEKHPPTDIVVLAWSDDFSKPIVSHGAARANVVTFGSLRSRERIASALNIPLSQIIDLELKLSSIVDDSDVPDGSEFAEERGRDAELEPFIPFSLLIQDYFDDILPDDRLPTPPDS